MHPCSSSSCTPVLPAVAMPFIYIQHVTDRFDIFFLPKGPKVQNHLDIPGPLESLPAFALLRTSWHVFGAIASYCPTVCNIKDMGH